MTPKYQQHELREIFDQNFKSIHTRRLSVQFQVSNEMKPECHTAAVREPFAKKIRTSVKA